MTLSKDSRNHHEDTRCRPRAETRERRGIGRNNNRQRIADGQPGSGGVKRVLREELGICGIDILWPVQVQSASPLVTETEFPGAGDFALDSEIRLMRVSVDETFRQRERKRKNWQRV